MAYADSIRTTDYTREELANLIDGNRIVGEAPLTSGTAPNYTVTLSPAPTAYFDGMIVAVKCHSTFTGGSQATINVNGLGAKNIRIRINDGSGSRNVYPYEMLANVGYLLQYDGVQFYLLNPQGGFALDTANKAWVTGGTQPNYTVDIYPAPAAYFDGMTFVVKFHSTLTGIGATINVNNTFARDIKIPGAGTGVRDPYPGELATNTPYLMTYNSATGDFHIISPTHSGETFTPTIGSASGTASLNSSTCTHSFFANKILVSYNINLTLTGATSTYITANLPFARAASFDEMPLAAWMTSVSGQTDRNCNAIMSTSGTVYFYRGDGIINWPINDPFIIYAMGIYQASF